LIHFYKRIQKTCPVFGDVEEDVSPLSLLVSIKPREIMNISQHESDSGYSCSPTLHSVSDTDTQGTISVTDTCAGPEIAPFDDGEQFDESEFRPATEVFSGGDLDFLQQHGTTSSSVSHLARQSLYVKFDPLIGGRPSVMGRPSMAPFKTPAGVESLIDMQSQSPCRRLEETVQETDTTLTTSSSETETLEHGLSVQEAQERDSRLQDFQENLLQREEKLLQLQKDLKVKMDEVGELKEQLKVKMDSEKQMREVVAEYERTISELISDKEKEKSEMEVDVSKMIAEKNQAVEDLQNVEAAFADVHRKYERTKQVVEGFKKNEEQLKAYIEEYKNKLKRQDQKYQLLKEHAEEKLEEANKEIDNISRSQEAEVAKLTALLQKTEMKAKSLEQTVEQKVKENEELTAICDELIAKVGS